MYLQKVRSIKTFFFKISFFLASRKSMMKIAGTGSKSRSTPKCHGSATLLKFFVADPDLES
jgi:hypothetical protein